MDKCRHEAAVREPHVCPLEMALYSNDEFQCNCCVECTEECSDAR